jgi:hypothetical protein
MSETHAYHPQASALNILNENCPRCKQHTLGSLDGDHLRAACGIDEGALRTFLRQYPQMHYAVMSLNALDIQRDWLDRLLGGDLVGDQRRYHDAAWAPINVPVYGNGR